MRVIHSLVTLYVGVAALHQVAHAQPEVVIRIAAIEEMRPRYVKSADGSATGLCIDLFKALARVGSGLRFVGQDRWVPLVRAEAEVFTGSEDAMCGVARTIRREKMMVFLEPSIATVDLMLVARANDDIDVKTWEEVRKLGSDTVVLSNRGTFASEFIYRIGGIQHDSAAATSKQNLRKLAAGRARLFLARADLLGHLLEQAGLREQLRVLPTVMGSAKLYVVLSRHVNGHTLTLVKRALADLQRTGELDLIKKRWIQEE